MSKARTLKNHTKKRLLERYGLNYSQYIEDNIKGQISKNKAILIHKQSNRVSVYLCQYNILEKDIADPDLAKVGDSNIFIVYDKHRKTIITVLTEQMVKSNDFDLE